jgi:Na+-driven multidrug efflux pump
MFLARRRPILSALFISFVLLSAFAVYLEVRDSHAGDSILRMIGYVSGSALAILAGIGMPVLGALVGAKKVDEAREAWRWTLGGSGTVLLGLTLYAISEFARNVYRGYFDNPRIRQSHHYFFPMQWQDILAELPIACVLIALLFFATYLLLSALRPKPTSKIAVSS